jgi:arylsulfatase A-like enzyme
LENGIEFHRHYTASTACVPSRTCLFTGQFTSVHGVHQTTGAAKEHDDERLKWLEPNTFPTMGNYFQAAGYDTVYKGKWHISEEDIHDEKGFAPQSTDPAVYKEYVKADKLAKFGFNGWIGPEPHGVKEENMGTPRDHQTAADAIKWLEERERSGNDKPFLLVICLVNPHDVMFYPLAWMICDDGTAMWSRDHQVPYIPEPPSRREDLTKKPAAQKQFRDLYPIAFQQNPLEAGYRNLYHHLIKEMDEHTERIYDALKQSKFFDNSLVVFTSDHGDTLGAHGGLQQKFHQAYEETIRIPLVISSPKYKGHFDSQNLTSHVDLIPTLLSLAGVDLSTVQQKLKDTHSRVLPLPGRDLAPIINSIIRDGTTEASDDEMIYFETFDEITRGSSQVRKIAQTVEILQKLWHWEFDHVSAAPSIESIVLREKGTLWKVVHYHDDPNFNWSHPHVKDEYVKKTGPNRGQVISRTTPLPEEFELYNLTEDPMEVNDLSKTRKDKLDYLMKKLNARKKECTGDHRIKYTEPIKLRSVRHTYDHSVNSYLPGRLRNPIIVGYIIGFVFVALYFFKLSFQLTFIIGLGYLANILRKHV